MEGPEKKKRIGDEEILQFSKTLNRSEYYVVEQLKKLPTQIFILSFLLSTEEHTEALLKF